MTHTFIIKINPYKYENPTLDAVRSIYVGNTCLIAKNEKYGKPYLHPKAKIVKGSFLFGAGSHSYPVLLCRKPVVIEVTDFYCAPNFRTDQCEKQDFIEILKHEIK